MTPRRWRHISKTLDQYANQAGSASLVIYKAPPGDVTEIMPQSMVDASHQVGARRQCGVHAPAPQHPVDGRLQDRCGT